MSVDVRNRQKEPRGGITKAAIVLLVLILLVAIPWLPRSMTIQVPYTTAETQSNSAFQISSYTLPAGDYTFQSANLPLGSDVLVSWSASDAVDVYAFSSSQFAAYRANGDTSHFMASQNNLKSGTFSFHVSATDTYYLMIHNGNTGTIFGIGSHSVGIFNAGGVYTTQVISTKTSTSTTSCTLNLIAMVSKSGC